MCSTSSSTALRNSTPRTGSTFDHDQLPDQNTSPTNVRSYLEFYDAFSQAASDPDVRAIILSGAGRAFCSGLDLTATSDFPQGEMDDSRRAIALYHHIKEFQKCIGILHDINKRMSFPFALSRYSTVAPDLHALRS